MQVVSTSPSGRMLTITNFLVDFRVPLSVVMFTSLVLLEMVDDGAQHSLSSGFAAPLAWGPTLIGTLLVLAGLAVRSWAAGILMKGHGLTNTGPYSLCRHPLYLGSALMMAGFCHLTCDPIHYIPFIIAIGLVYCLTVAREERRLAARFPENWQAYRNVTPRLVPWRLRSFVAGAWSTKIWLRNREYQALFGSLAGLCAIELWQYFSAAEGLFAAK